MTEARSIMTKKIIKIYATTPVQVAYEEMRENNIRHLPVVDQSGALVGMISDRDIQRALNVRKMNEIEEEFTFNPHHTVEDFMSWPVRTIDEKTSIKDVCRLMIDEKVSAYIISGPNHYMKGIITTDDLLQYLLEMINDAEEFKKIPTDQMYWKNL